MMDADKKEASSASDRLTDEEIIANMLLLLIAGYETTSTHC